MEPILRAQFNKFKQTFEINTSSTNIEDERKKDASAFEKFVNYTIFSQDYPEIFTADIDLLDFISVGGGGDTYIDGIGIKVNDRLIRNISEIEEIIEANRKIEIDFVFIQSKLSQGFDAGQFQTFGVGVKHFFHTPVLPENDKIKEFREIKDYIYRNEILLSKLKCHPNLFLYYVGIGVQPTDSHFAGTKILIENEIKNGSFIFETINISIIDGKTLTSYNKELDNSFSAFLNILDIFPLFVDQSTEVKKAYAFTATAKEFLNVLTKEGKFLRRSLFNDNVRDYLDKSSINVEIEKTITHEPNLFLLCNNGITIVCSDFEQIRDKYIKIENPQIVNGCQTSNSIFNLKNNENFGKVQLLIRLICTDDLNVSNKIVRGTNKQNQVLDEAFEATKPFHKDLEEFFLVYNNETKIYYERRSRQYNNDPLIKKTQVVNLRILTQTFVAMFVNAPHESHKHESKLLESYVNNNVKIFNETHSFYPYYAAALTFLQIEKYFRINIIPQKYKPYKGQLYFLVKHSVGEYPPNLLKSKSTETYCNKLLLLLKDDNFEATLQPMLEVFDESLKLWMEQGNSQYAVKDRKEFTTILTNNARQKFHTKRKQIEEIKTVNINPKFKGQIFSIIKNDDRWFGFIKSDTHSDNVYFDNRSYKDEFEKLKPNKKVEFEVTSKSNNRLYALSVDYADEN